MKIYVFLGVEISSAVEVEVVSMDQVRLDSSEAAIKFAEEISSFGVKNVVMSAGTADEALQTLRHQGIKTFSYDTTEKSFTEIV
jgi:predicted Fe-Mo cluster-binding NifX family protein